LALNFQSYFVICKDEIEVCWLAVGFFATVSRRICYRDLLICIAWRSAAATNQQIGEKFRLTYSAIVSQRVCVIEEMFNNDKELERKYRHVKSQINI
jgi:hypothetical protein